MRFSLSPLAEVAGIFSIERCDVLMKGRKTLVLLSLFALGQEPWQRRGWLTNKSFKWAASR